MSKKPLRTPSRIIRRRRPTQAERADRHVLYQDSVQDPEWEMRFISETYQTLRGRRAVRLREDFCGTALFSCEWVRGGRDREAVGVDLDPEVLEWGRRHNLARLDPARSRRIRLVNADVLDVKTRATDIVIAFNFSYWIFRERRTLKRYFRNVRDALGADGLFILDAYGGYNAFRDLREREDFGRFTYIWEQADYDPVSGDTVCHIHYTFPDGSRLDRAFTYHWRLWTLAELRELLAEAGFTRSTVYWQGTDPKTGEGTDEYSPVTRGDADPAWVAYLVAEK